MKVSSSKSVETAPYRTIWSITWPQMAMMLFHFLIGFTDVLVAGRLGREVQASMGMITQALFFFMVVAIALANGSVAAISQSIGAGRYGRVKRYIGLCIQLGFGFSFTVMIVALLVHKHVLALLQIPPSMAPVAEYIFFVFLLTLPTYYLFIITNAVFRAQKMVMYPLYAMGLVTLVNTVLDFALGLGYWSMPRFGYKGLAWATFFSVSLGMTFNVFNLWRIGLLRRESFAPMRWVKKAWPYLFKVAWPAGMMQVVWHSAYLVLYAITASLPKSSVVALAGMSAGMRIESLLFLPGFAFNFTASILIGHYIGACKPKEAKLLGYKILGVGVLLITCMTVLLWFHIDTIARFVAPDPTVWPEAIQYLQYNMAAIPFLLTAMILGGAFTGAGATLYQMMVFGFSAWFVRIPLAYFLGHRIVESSEGIWMAMFASMFVQSLIMLAMYQFSNWHSFGMRTQKGECKPPQSTTILTRQ